MSRDKVLPWAIAGLALAAPLLIGGAPPAIQVVLSLAALVLVAGYVWTAPEGKGLTPVPLMWPLLIALGATALQLVPLPAFLVQWLSPLAYELRSDTGGAWLMPLSVDVPATWLALARGFACAGLFMVVATELRSHRQVRPLLLSLAAMGAGLAIIILISRAFGSQTLLGFYRPRSMPGSGLWGTFVSANHAASVLGLSALVGAGLALDAKGGQRLLFIAGAVLSATVMFYTASRAGAVGFAVGGFVLTGVALVRRLGWATGLFTALALLAVASGATLWMADGLRSRLLPSAPDALVENQKLRGWRDAGSLTLAYRWTGVGRGAFEAPASAFRQDDEAVRLVYPENLLLQASTEWGVPVTLLIIGLVGVALLKSSPGLRRRELAVIGAVGGVTAVLAHEAADFGLELLGVALPTMLALAVVIARSERHNDRHRREPRPRLQRRWVMATLAVWGLAVLGAAWAVPHTLDADFDRVASAYKERHPHLQAWLEAALVRHPADDHLELIAAEDAMRRKDPSALRHLNRALRLHPSNWQAHYLAARTLLALNKTQAALEYRLAIERGMLLPLQEMMKALGPKIVDAVPERTTDLMLLCRLLADKGWIAPADEACRRGIALASTPAPYLVERVQIALMGRDKTMIVSSAQALLDSGPEIDASVMALNALAQSGDVAATDEALARTLKAHPEVSLLTLTAAQIRFDRGDVAGARELIKHVGDNSYSLTERLRAEELLAKIADKQGDVDGAIIARARARMIGHKLNDTSAIP